MIRPLHVVPGVTHHGVVRYACDVGQASGCVIAADVTAGPRQLLHLHFTERLWGADPAAAATRVCEIARHHGVTVTLHDLPQASDGAASQQRRSAAYGRVVDAARAVACNSHWEAQLLAAFAQAHQPPIIIPLPVVPPAVSPSLERTPRDGPIIGLLGFVYPGKGHAEAIDAAAACARSLGTEVSVIALGTVAEGHEDDVRELHDRARGRGVTFSVTGYVTDAQLMSLARQVDIPLAAHRHLSASGSIGSWLSAGRRPLVADSVYAREIDALRPGTICRYDPSDLDEAVRRTLTRPQTSWLSPCADLRPGLADTAAAYLDWWTREVQW